MNNLKQKLIIWVPLTILVVGSIYYARRSGELHISGSTMGTTYNVKISYKGEEPNKEAIKKQIDKILVDFNNELSTYIPDSEISIFNKSNKTDWFNVSKNFINISLEAQKIYKQTSSFDPTLGPAINLWGFGEDGEWNNPPSKEKIDSIREIIGFDNISIDKHHYRIKKKNPKTQINLSAIAKGYGVDLISNYLKKIKAHNHMVEIGGEIAVSNEEDSFEKGKEWNIGIESPNDTNVSLQRIIKIRKGAIATSGNYRNYFKKDGVRYSHIIDSKTLSPVNHNLASVTVYAASCVEADGWATALLALPPKEALNMAEKAGLAVYMILESKGKFKTLETRAFSKQFK